MLSSALDLYHGHEISSTPLELCPAPKISKTADVTEDAEGQDSPLGVKADAAATQRARIETRIIVSPSFTCEKGVREATRLLVNWFDHERCFVSVTAVLVKS